MLLPGKWAFNTVTFAQEGVVMLMRFTTNTYSEMEVWAPFNQDQYPTQARKDKGEEGKLHDPSTFVHRLGSAHLRCAVARELTSTHLRACTPGCL